MAVSFFIGTSVLLLFGLTVHIVALLTTDIISNNYIKYAIAVVVTFLLWWLAHYIGQRILLEASMVLMVACLPSK